MAGNSAESVLIVGAGIVGCATAYFLAREGVKSVVLERTGPAAEASGANAGMIGVGGGLEKSSSCISSKPGRTLE